MKVVKITSLFLIFYVFSIAQNSVNYTPLIEDKDFRRSLGGKKAVGVIPHSFEVTNLGGAQYSMPIDLPLGTNAMMPEVSLVYNSQQGNGIAGYGWSISGLSRISRIHKNIHFDGKVSPVDYSNEDPFVLDGQRLILENGQNGANGSEYRTEYESFSKIILHGSGTQMYFEVTTKEGMVMRYGRANNSKVLNNDNNAITQFKLDRVIDRNRN